MSVCPEGADRFRDQVTVWDNFFLKSECQALGGEHHGKAIATAGVSNRRHPEQGFARASPRQDLHWHTSSAHFSPTPSEECSRQTAPKKQTKRDAAPHFEHKDFDEKEAPKGISWGLYMVELILNERHAVQGLLRTATHDPRDALRVFYCSLLVIFRETGNRQHTIKAVMCAWSMETVLPVPVRNVGNRTKRTGRHVAWRTIPHRRRTA